ncbi:MAG: matrix protein [Fuyun tick rhabdovirus]|uniref:Matrix protein n=1 Tax=Fuyun tick rhabdovirus TaxID=2977134 RepID=A0A977R7T6_9RHAB|nr:MAG: matrix protein [Fuyun tick rhabdovirus]
MSKPTSSTSSLYVEMSGEVEVITLTRPSIDKILGRILQVNPHPQEQPKKHLVRGIIASILRALTFEPARGRKLLSTEDGPRMGYQFIWSMASSTRVLLDHLPKIQPVPSLSWVLEGTYHSTNGTFTSWKIRTKATTGSSPNTPGLLLPSRVLPEELLKAKELLKKYGSASSEPGPRQPSTSQAGQQDKGETLPQHQDTSPRGPIDLGGLRRRH